MIIYKQGNLLDSDCTVIVHQVNCLGIMDEGIAKQIKEKYPCVYEDYKRICDQQEEIGDLLGHVQIVDTKEGKYIANLFSQKDTGRNEYKTNYEAFDRGCEILSGIIIGKNNNPEIHNKWTIAFPYSIGCGLAGGTWKKVYDIINKHFGYNHDDIECRIYELL